MGSCGSKVNIVIACSCANNNFQLLCRFKYFGINLVRANYHGVSILYGIKKLLFLCIFLKQSQFMTCSLYFFSYTLNGCCRKRLLGCN